jgi:hypothetical protein
MNDDLNALHAQGLSAWVGEGRVEGGGVDGGMARDTGGIRSTLARLVRARMRGCGTRELDGGARRREETASVIMVSAFFAVLSLPSLPFVLHCTTFPFIFDVPHLFSFGAPFAFQILSSHCISFFSNSFLGRRNLAFYLYLLLPDPMSISALESDLPIVSVPLRA